MFGRKSSYLRRLENQLEDVKEEVEQNVSNNSTLSDDLDNAYTSVTIANNKLRFTKHDNTHDEIDHVDLDPVLAGLNYQTASQVDSNITASLNGLFKAASFDNVSRVFTLTKYDDSIVSLPIPQTDLTTVNNTLSTLQTNQDGLFKSVTISATVYVAVLWGILAHYTQILHPNTTP